MRFAFTGDQLLFRDAVRDMLQKECPPDLVRSVWSNEKAQMAGLWQKLAAMGVVGLTVPEAHGGLGLSELDLVLLLEEAGRVASPAPLLETTAVGAPLLCDTQNSGAIARWISPVVAGTAILTVGLEGAPYVADADIADLLVLERAGELHALPRDVVRLIPQPSVDGARHLFTVDWAPSAATLISEGDAARRAADAAFNRGALATAAELIGLARHLLDVTVGYAKVRHQFGKPIGSFQAIKHHLADALLKVEFARPVVYRAAYSMTHEDTQRAVHVSMAKAQAAEAAMAAARVALQCHGAIGYTTEYDLHLWMKRVWALAPAFGDAGWHRARVGAAIFGSESGGT